jgi:hypothetical protein
MDTSRPFFEAVFTAGELPQAIQWRDESTGDDYIFTSAFGSLRLRKRYAYPTTFAHCNGTVLSFGYGDMTHGRSIANSELMTVAEHSFGVEEFLYGEIDCRNQSVMIQRDTASVLPIFVARHNSTLAISNHSNRLSSMINAEKTTINTLAAINYMLFDDRYRALLDHSEPLYDRVRLTWQGGEYIVQYPPDGLITQLADMPVSSASQFKQALESTLDAYWNRYDNIAFQLSGGVDSAVAPGYYADKGNRVLAVSLGLPGEMGARQHAKLTAMQERFGIDNYIVDLDPSKHTPFMGTSQGNQGVSEFSDLHLVATRQLADYLAERRIATVFTGVGGDELCQNVDPRSVLPFGAVQEERLQAQLPSYTTDAFARLYQKTQTEALARSGRPVPAIAYSTLLTHLGFNNTFIDRNIWPVAPLADPTLFLFTQTIPAWHRYDKNLLRIYQFARGYPESIVHPETTEDFSEFIHMCKPKLEQLFTDRFQTSRLAEQGLIDSEQLRRYVQEVVNAPFDKDDTRILELMRLLVLETNLQRL